MIAGFLQVVGSGTNPQRRYQDLQRRLFVIEAGNDVVSFQGRVPTTLHERSLTSIVEEIQVQLKPIRGASAEFAKEIRSRRSASIKSFDEEYGRHDSDKQFRHSKAQFPGILIEVSYA